MKTKIFSILHFNVWLLKLYGITSSEHIQERLALIPDALALENADVISLVEVWRVREKKFLVEKMRERGYSYSYFSHSGVWVGDGMLLLSKFPIERVEHSRPFRRATRFLELFSKKRGVKALLEIPEIGKIAVYQTHLGSKWFDLRTLEYDKKTREILHSQVHELAEFLRSKHNEEKGIFLAGDLNFHYQTYMGRRQYGPPHNEKYNTLVHYLRDEHLALENSFLVANGLSESDPAAATYSQTNPYVARGQGTGYPEETLDYILYQPSSHIRVVESRIVFRESPSPSVPALSDHYGIKSVFEFSGL